MNKEFIAEEFRKLQLHIIHAIERMDGKTFFQEDQWNREEGGGGYTCTIKEGAILEKGGVAFSSVHGPVSEVMKKQLNLNGDSFFATGVSIVLHPHNPFVPIIHMNVRYFEMSDGTYWFGGGIDLTPHYIDKKAASIFHQDLKLVCANYSPEFYSKFKNQADDYFFLPHREETRGIGGVFYDHMHENNSGISKQDLFDMAIDLGKSFPIIYAKQVELGKDKTYTEDNIAWRNTRRGRYVEFNLVNDRGTKFGLLSGGRTESILMSLPPHATWEYCKEITKDSREFETNSLLKKQINWI
jgi:coproporphyrinogen III oxidase